VLIVGIAGHLPEGVGHAPEPGTGDFICCSAPPETASAHLKKSSVTDPAFSPRECAEPIAIGAVSA